jgi:ABC-type nitrate/sulfonate/bicarbonate transport system permease component
MAVVIEFRDASRLYRITRMARKCIAPVGAIVALLGVWQAVCAQGLVSKFVLPSPVAIVEALVKEFPLLMKNASTSLVETTLGLLISILLAYCTVILMDKFAVFERTLLPIITFTQTIPTIAIAPLLILWMGFGIAPKVTLIVVVCYFPLALGLLSGFKSVTAEYKMLIEVLKLPQWKVLLLIKIRGTLKEFFVGLKIAISYAVVGAVIAEWLGGESGLGVYMMRVRKAYAYDKMFAVILLVSVISLLLLGLVSIVEKRVLRYEKCQDSARPKKVRDKK